MSGCGPRVISLHCGTWSLMGAQRTLCRRHRLGVTATTDFLAPDVLDRCDRAVPAPSDTLHSTCGSISQGTAILRRAAIVGGPPSVSITRTGCAVNIPLTDWVDHRPVLLGTLYCNEGRHRSAPAPGDGFLPSPARDRLPIADGITSSRHHHATAAQAARGRRARCKKPEWAILRPYVAPAD
jgi:hypothetical protein